MRQNVFRLSKIIGNCLSGYMFLIYLVLMAMISLLKMKGLLSVSDKILETINKLEVYTDKYMIWIIGLSIVFLVVSVVFSDLKGYMKGICISVLVVYAMTYISIYKLVVSTIGTKLSLTTDSFNLFVGYAIVFLILLLIKKIFNLSDLKVKDKISHRKIDELIDEYLHEEDTFNLALCDSLIRKYGGNVNE